MKRFIPFGIKTAFRGSNLALQAIPFLRNSPVTQLHFYRLYHCSSICLKKASGKDGKDSKDGKGKGKGKNDADTEPVELPDLKSYDQSMENSLKWFDNELQKLKSGRVTIDLFTDLPVESYGTVGKAGQVTLKSPTRLVVSVYDPAIAPAVAEAIKNCGLGINPQIDGSNVIALIPKPSKEARELMLKTASKLAEKVKLDIRNVRKNALDGFKSLKNKVSDDDIKRLTKELDNYTQARSNKVDQLFKAKEKEVLADN